MRSHFLFWMLFLFIATFAGSVSAQQAPTNNLREERGKRDLNMTRSVRDFEDALTQMEKQGQLNCSFSLYSSEGLIPFSVAMPAPPARSPSLESQDIKSHFRETYRDYLVNSGTRDSEELDLDLDAVIDHTVYHRFTCLDEERVATQVKVLMREEARRH